MQGRLDAWHGHELTCTHFTPGQCVQNWDAVRGTGLAVTAGPVFIGGGLQTNSKTSFGHC